MPNQVTLGPSGRNYHNGPAGLESLTGTGGVPFIGMVENCRVTRLAFLFIMRVIDDKQVSTLTGDGTTDTDSEVAPSVGGIPASCRLGVCTFR